MIIGRGLFIASFLPEGFYLAGFYWWDFIGGILHEGVQGGSSGGYGTFTYANGMKYVGDFVEKAQYYPAMAINLLAHFSQQRHMLIASLLMRMVR